jgi:uncharacterized protein (TIGR02145 family)
VQGVCPDGWHLPSRTEFEALITAVGGQSKAGKKLKGTTLWIAEDGIANEDAYGFSALPAGEREYEGNFIKAGEYAYFWSTTQDGGDHAYIMYLDYRSNKAGLNSYYKSHAFSVRCLENSKLPVELQLGARSATRKP